METGRRGTEQRLTKYRRFVFTPQKFAWLWEEITKLSDRTLTDDVTGPDELMQTLRNPQCIHLEAYEGDQIVGWAMWAGVTAWSATAHLTFFDKRLRGREQSILELIRFFMDEMKWQVVHAYLPETHRASIAWCQRIGFTVDGRQRRALRRRGKLLDYVVLAITREEAFRERGGMNGARRKPANVAAAAPDAGSAAADRVPDPRPLPAQLAQPGAGLLRRLSRSRRRGESVSEDADLGG